MRKFLIVVILLTIGLFFVFDAQQYLTLENLKDSRADFQSWQAGRPVLVRLIFMTFYVLVTALSLPGAAIMTLAAGGLFGLWWGTLLMSFSSSIGATLAFLVSRFLWRDWVQQRFGERLKTMNTGIEREGGFYSFTLRLVPIFPFFVINLLMGLTPFKTWTFYWVSQLGMFAGTLVYVNAGTPLAKIDNLASIMSFELLGIFPLLAKKILDLVQHRRG